MVGPGVRVHQLTVDIPDDPAHISEQVRAEVRGEERLAVLGGKDDMGEEVGKGVSHRLSPPWGSHILTQLLIPRLTTMNPSCETRTISHSCGSLLFV